MRYQSTPASSPDYLRDRLRRLARNVAIAALLLYVGAVMAGFLWLRHGRDNRHVTVMDVAFLQLKSIRQALAKGYLDQARAELEKKDYQAAYVSFMAATNNDPSNLDARLEAVAFFRQMGADTLALMLLEEGLARSPNDARLIRQTFEKLLAEDRHRYALDLMRKRYPQGLAGPHGSMLQAFEIQATLKAEGLAAAQALIVRYPGLENQAEATPVLARVLWETGEKLKAMRLLAGRVAAPEATLADFKQLAHWQLEAAEVEEAVKTAQLACTRFDGDLSARVLLIETQAAESVDSQPQRTEIEAYLRKFSGRPEALGELALLAGRKGWVDLARTLYVIGAARLPDLGLLAMGYADALARNSRFTELRELLTQLEGQISESSNVNYVRQVLHRQIIAAGVMGDAVAERDYAHRLASNLGRDLERKEAFRRHFQQVGLLNAVAVFTPRAGPSRASVNRPASGG